VHRARHPAFIDEDSVHYGSETFSPAAQYLIKDNKCKIFLYMGILLVRAFFNTASSTVASLALAVRRSNHSARSHPKVSNLILVCVSVGSGCVESIPMYLTRFRTSIWYILYPQTKT
jgi:hypothetical protein